MGEGVPKRMYDFGSFVSFKGTNSGRTFGVFYQHLHLDLGVIDCGRRNKRQAERRGRGLQFDRGLIFMMFVHRYLFIFKILLYLY